MKYIWRIISIIQTNFLFLISIINRLFYHFVVILVNNEISVNGAKELAEALKLNKNLTTLNICKTFAIISPNNFYYSILFYRNSKEKLIFIILKTNVSNAK